MKKYFLVTNPENHIRLIFAETSFQAIAIAVEKDGYKWSNSKYTAKNAKTLK